ncbi:4'-phosphopantetheinyl transferase superfamily protein [Chitinophaga horti]|uniref:Enterobactin synthase component D n=1 Tax=Chitinophaga horti TaxID=2920382 RepID=A0ABY6J3H4_9BACT|nr:4'-phosphopantetheinyl transferase superfamily protein [Chitinophaga horti]UYQ94219.1 4'-phosphopantetheinyl transferase superfamily protein [Chitinophaga horti]
MPILRTIQIDEDTKLGVWKISEKEAFFRKKVAIEPEVHHPHKRLQHFAGRYLLQELFPDFPVNNIRVRESRKPYLPDDSFHFSISHCDDYAAAIVSRKAGVGIDIELAQPKIEKVSHKFLGPQELAFMDPGQPLLHKSVCWSAKEAVFKWYGEGKVDFREHMQLHPFRFMQTGIIVCDFLKPDKNARLYLHYLMDGNMCLAWVVE